MCRSFYVSGKCDRGRLRFKGSLTRNISGDAGFGIACHEIGHAVGAEHYQDGGCMPSTMSLDWPFTNVLSSHLVAHIDAQYG
ncbi:reprolysin-like metallopeptidase [Dactylosporangium sp. NPDC050688]|uniref:reprolysin-like metallopeptidase n=1 Tax=Dactylosporangium sp. NPDC050688 TaxID=3157217 RepID=UPI0033F887E7